MTNRPEPSPFPSPPSTQNPSLPDDLLLSCFARLSRLNYLTLSLVSKRFRSLLASPELYKARSILGNNETCLYVCIDFYPRSRWYTLYLKPNQILTNDNSDDKKEKKSSGYVLARVADPRSPRAHFNGLVAVGSNIYRIKERSSNVSVLDCQSHTWREAPSLPVKLVSLSASVLDGKIYVAGGHVSEFLKNTLEVFDTETQTWDIKTIPCTVTKSNCYYPTSACIDGKLHVKTSTEAVVYNCKKNGWDLIEPEMFKYMIAESYCVIENVLYSASYGLLRWYDSEESKWRRLKGLEGLPKLDRPSCVRLADYGGKLAVLWEGELFDLRHGGSYRKIWCAVIALDRRKILREIRGKVEWFDDLLTIPKLCKLVKVLSVTL